MNTSSPQISDDTPIVIIGSGFGAYQLVKSIRRLHPEQPITVICADDGSEYSKPDLSHVFSRNQQARDLVKLSGVQFAHQQRITLLANSTVTSIDTNTKTVQCGIANVHYHKLVLATGANAIVPSLETESQPKLLTLNSLGEYQRAQRQLQQAQRVAVLGAGLIGTEIAMDLAQSGKEVVLIDRANRVLPNLLPEFVASQLQLRMTQQNQHRGAIQFELNTELTRVISTEHGTSATLANGHQHQVDAVISAIGLHPNTSLAKVAGIEVNRGIVVNDLMQTSNNDVYAIGDCAELNGQLRPYLQPVVISANALANTLCGQPTVVSLPPMLVKVKTPWLPIALAGQTAVAEANWQIELDQAGMVAKAHGSDGELIGVVVTEQKVNAALPLLRHLPAA
ncbi:NADH:flavorubredoxin reductase NorW [Ferrimonas lipolytica]|uniref:NADH:flavorubredoxin reductase NorW n=1 Tax=Ferrimonas lipolytica TaxID=2724191 RepID=A0A6H1UF01_9GAMM|nr:NADH:flavorubredoxin reductase NorW [Ferrimonas lipolytica]QIZ77209.1 NADH:flavorubredoxin reductase NorW [Ferrimonas lipolytica]